MRLGPESGVRISVSICLPATSSSAGADRIVRVPASVAYVGRISSGTSMSGKRSSSKMSLVTIVGPLNPVSSLKTALPLSGNRWSSSGFSMLASIT